MLSPFLKSSRLHSFNNSYYLVLPNANIKFEKFKQIHYAIIEFANFIDASELFERKLLEYGKIIFKTNSIKSLNQRTNALTASSASMLSMFCMARPLEFLVPSGISYTFNQ